MGCNSAETEDSSRAASIAVGSYKSNLVPV